MEDSEFAIVVAMVLGGVYLVLYGLGLFSSKPGGSSLPKGSLGWPLIGETLEFARDPLHFAHSRAKRYGSVFKSSILLRRTIFGTTPEFAKFVFTNRDLFKHTFPEHVASVLGPKAFMFFDGPRHMSVRKVVLKSIGAEALRNQVHTLETIILDHLASWARADTLMGIDAMQKLTWDTSNWVLFGDTKCRSTPEGIQNFEYLKQIRQTTVSLPVNLPGTDYRKGMKARKALIKHFRNLIDKTRGQKATEGVFFQALVAARDDPEEREELKELDDAMLADNIFLLNFTAYDTTSTTLVWILKFLVDNPDVFRRVQAEQLALLKTKDASVEVPRLTWEDTRTQMPYTQKFFQETQRILSLVPFGLMEATQDVQFAGHLIPKGWMVMPAINYIHSDPTLFSDLSFNPDRFDVVPKPYTYLPFSAGAHMCPGMEMAKLISFVFVHHLTTGYIYESLSPDMGLEYDAAFPKPKGGYPIKVRPRN